MSLIGSKLDVGQPNQWSSMLLLSLQREDRPCPWDNSKVAGFIQYTLGSASCGVHQHFRKTRLIVGPVSAASLIGLKLDTGSASSLLIFSTQCIEDMEASEKGNMFSHSPGYPTDMLSSYNIAYLHAYGLTIVLQLLHYSLAALCSL
ncbi:hypothetical protein CY34DRAFT_15821 [Suillus luteus UH-Slu-Lm8-n1]|uniref:Uncharacterized protein n=1 Tax=Suillus luteus UH-Slu-Lm8-n1 TaxID=930992 RepID=A0A0D0A6P7_9AGAM|nr:hypothetical protein CY34DRAFT_15821 [Suillus luteus UH-Slu-Lm8-n1]